RAGADGHYGLGPVDLPVDCLDGVDRVFGDRAGDAKNVSVPRATFQAHAQLLGVVARRERGHDLDVAAVATARVHVNEPWAVAAAIAHQFIPELHGLPPSSICSVSGQTPAATTSTTSATMTACNTNGS